MPAGCVPYGALLDQQLPIFPPDEKPFPRRFWWLKRMSVGMILFVLLVCGLRWWAIADARRRLDREVEALRAAGQKVLPADFVQTPIPDAENAATFLRQAEAAFQIYDNDDNALDSISFSLPLSPANQKLIERVMAEHPRTLECIRRARGCKDTNWGISFLSPVISTLLPELNEARRLAIFTALSAFLAHEQGDDTEAVERVRDILAISRAVDREPFVVSHLVSIGIAQVASSAARSLAPVIKVRPDRAPRGAATPAQIQALIDDLLPDPTACKALEDCLAGECMMGIDAVKWFSDSGSLDDFSQYFARVTPLGVPQWIPLFRPMILQEGRQIVHADAAWIDAARQPDATSAIARLPALTKNSSRGPIFPWLLGSPKNALFNRHFACLRTRNQAAILLAEKLYLEKHRHPASSIDELVPEFLPVVPDDPMSGGKLGLQGLLPPLPASRPGQ